MTRIPLAAGTMGAGYVVMALATSLPVGALGCFIGGLGNGFYFVSVIQAIQERTADEYQGRVMGLLESTTAGGYGVGFLLAAAITELTSVRVTFAATAVGVILATILMATLLRRTAAAELRTRARRRRRWPPSRPEHHAGERVAPPVAVEPRAADGHVSGPRAIERCARSPARARASTRSLRYAW